MGEEDVDEVVRGVVGRGDGLPDGREVRVDVARAPVEDALALLCWVKWFGMGGLSRYVCACACVCVCVSWVGGLLILILFWGCFHTYIRPSLYPPTHLTDE